MMRSPRAGVRITCTAFIALAGSIGWTSAAAAQGQVVGRAVPAAVSPPPGYAQALDRGWRSTLGSPGAGYWQQGTSYDIEATLDPETGELSGTARIAYANNAPLTLGTVWLHLHQNFHQAGALRNRTAEVTDGITLSRVVAGGRELEAGPVSDGPAYSVDGAVMQIRPPSPVSSGDTLTLEIDWSFTVPQQGIGERMGHSNREMYMIAYWFPKMAVLDDLRGGAFDAEPFLGTGEFYDDFADYTVAITVPEDWTVMATGALENPSEVFSALTIELLEAAATADTLVTIAGQGDRDAGTVTADAPEGSLTYRFTAQRVRDFAWTTSNTQRWDATSAVVPDRDDDGEEDRVLIHSFWREDRAPLWAEEWLYAKQAIEFHSVYTGLPYPWPHMTSVEGEDIIEGGMEFPMMTLMSSYEGTDAQALYSVTAHELGHMWIPMIVGTNERRYAWMDEGSTDFLENESRMELWPGVDHRRVEARQYLEVAAGRQEQSLMRHSDYYEPGPGRSIASYRKPATLLVALREVIGSVLFQDAYKAFISEWAYKHPTPWDFFATFERFVGEDLDWFWSAFYYETWTVDHAVRSVGVAAGGGQTVVIEDRGNAPFPVHVRIRTSTGVSLQHDIGVEHWLAGNTTFEIEVPADAGRVTRVELDPTGFSPDVDRGNNFWPRG
ncbi:MAG: M1 family metallopeptidase [Gemmatimonadota bacterium]|nr:M1 family metallopeptidase [Gemmatimonadota bacterium]